jgi:oligopeptidase B
VYAEGGSAGGLLVGAVLNLRPDLYRGIIANMPFVDVLTTMLDDSIPLTTGEYDEWGNPNEKADYYDILKYSPYDNVSPTAYPHVLVTTGLYDSLVPYWEPAKWVAKLREYKTNHTLTLLKIDMSAGHEGVSGRYEALKDEALAQAFLLFIDR